MQLPVAQLSLAAGLAAAGLARLALSRARHGPDGDCDAIKCLNLSSWDADKPHSFYLSDDSFLLADCEATVEGARLPLHSSLLFKQCQALQRVIERAQLEASGTVSAHGGAACFPARPCNKFCGKLLCSGFQYVCNRNLSKPVPENRLSAQSWWCAGRSPRRHGSLQGLRTAPSGVLPAPALPTTGGQQQQLCCAGAGRAAGWGGGAGAASAGPSPSAQREGVPAGCARRHPGLDASIWGVSLVGVGSLHGLQAHALRLRPAFVPLQ